MTQSLRLGVNIDHVATLREARGSRYPNPVEAAMLAIKSGADGITLHLREDRRHIQEYDFAALKKQCTVPINLEMAVTDEMLLIAEKYRPEHVCFVPEKREELTTEGGLDVIGNEETIRIACQRLNAIGIQVSLFIAPDLEQIDAAIRCRAPVIEIHTGCFANARAEKLRLQELDRIQAAARYAHQHNILVNAGHGLHYGNVQTIAAIPELNELNIGHSIISQAIFEGLPEVIRKMKSLMHQAASNSNLLPS